MQRLKRLFAPNDVWLPQDSARKTALVGVLFVVAYYLGNMMTEELAIRITHLLHPEYVLDTPEFYAFLATNPWSFTLVCALWMLVYFVLLCLAGFRFFPAYRGLCRRKALGWLCFGLATTLALQGISVWLTRMSGSMSANQQLLNRQLVDAGWAVKAVVFILMPAFSEELVMRGVVQRAVFPKLPVSGLLVSAFLFQSMHYTTRLSDALLYFTSGLVYALVHYRTGRLEFAMLLHALNNLAALLLLSLTL